MGLASLASSSDQNAKIKAPAKLLNGWCGRRDLNPQALRAADFKSAEFTDFSTSAEQDVLCI